MILFERLYNLRFHHNKVPEVNEEHDDTSPGCKLIWFQDGLRLFIWLAFCKDKHCMEREILHEKNKFNVGQIIFDYRCNTLVERIYLPAAFWAKYSTSF